MRRAMATIAVVSAAFLGAAAGLVPSAAAPPEKDRASTEPAAAQGLRVTTEAADRVSGSYRAGGEVATFEAHRVSARESSATVDLDGRQITVTRDSGAGRATFDAGEAVLAKRDRELARGLGESLSRHWAAGNLPGHSDLVARVVNMMSEAPDGIALKSRKIVKPPEAWTDVRPDPAALRAAECPDGEAGVAAAGEPRADCQIESGEYIRYFETCDTGNRVFGHDWTDHCFESTEDFSGPGSPECFGRCGAGCPGVDNQYTYDCGDHDQCAGDHGENLGGCGDEWNDAADDYLFARNNCSGSAGTSGAAPKRPEAADPPQPKQVR